MHAQRPPAPAGAPSRLEWRELGSLLGATFASFSAHRGSRMGAALAYYTAFSLAPLVVFTLSLASLLVHKEVARDHIVGFVDNLIGPGGAATVRDIIEHAPSTQDASWGTALGFILLLVGASGAFGELQDSLNQVWEVPAPRNGFLAMMKDRVLSFIMVFVLGFFMLVSLLLSSVIAGVSRFVGPQLPAAGLEIANALVSCLVIGLLFATIFRLLPDVPIRWHDVWAGALFSAVLYVIGKLALGWYIGRNAGFSNYGAAGSFVVILFWVFYSAQILYLGAEFTRVYATRHGSHRPAPGADIYPS